MTNDGGEAYSMGMQKFHDFAAGEQVTYRRSGLAGTVISTAAGVSVQTANGRDWMSNSQAAHLLRRPDPVGELEGDSPTGFVITSTPEEQ